MEFLDEIINLLNEGKTRDVIDKITLFLDENPKYKTIDYFHFANPIEEILYGVYIGDAESINQLGLDEPLEEIYQIYSIAYMIEGKVDDAEKYLKIANQINPVSAIILMRICEFYQNKNEEEKLKDLALDLMKYTYDVELLISSYFKLADYYYHTNQELELYDHLFNFFIALKGEDKDVSEDIKFLESKGVQVGFNPEVVQILLYLYDTHSKQGFKATAEFFKNILDEIVEFSRFIKSLR